MNKRPLIITSLIILLIAAAAIVISNLNSTTYTVTFKSKEEGCSYSHKSSSGKVLLSKDFKYEDVMQCNLETRYKPDKNNSKLGAIDTYEFFLYTNYGMDVLNFKSKDGKRLAAICTNIFEKKPFNYRFKVKKEAEKQ